MSAFDSTASSSTLSVGHLVTFRNRDIISLSRGCDAETFRGILTCCLYSGVQSILDADRNSFTGRTRARVHHIDRFEESFFSKFGVFLEDDSSSEENPTKRRRTDNHGLLPEFLILEKDLAQCESYESVFSLLSNISRCISKCREGNTHSRLQFLQLLEATHGTPHEILSKLSAETIHTKGSNDNQDSDGQVKWRIELIEPALVDSTRQSFTEVFEMNAEVGKGGYGVVHKALCRPVNSNVAIKLLDRKKMDKKHEDGLRHEVKIMMDLSHPHIVKAYDLFGDSNSFYVVMELITGGELFDRIVRKTCYKEAEARQLARTLLGAIKYMHDHNIVHRDLKPENLLLTSDKNDFDIKVVDFGFATEVDGDNLIDQFGTPGYIAPEILRAAQYGKGVDMWSFGVILYILLGGYPPFYDNDRAMLFKKIKTAAYEFHEGYWNEVSDDAKDLIRRLLVVDMKTRLTVDQALAHPWFEKRRELLESRVLSHSLIELRKFQARRKLRAGIRSVLAIARMQSMASKSAFLRDQLFNMMIHKPVVTSSTSVGSNSTVARSAQDV